ncbi:uncharacterized protein PV07_08809 [Cladophialophora immunda]|uniref:Uncharacterized protein n=1 Tax=Cladophialophora immunda TaxID=569365 RepID=A0A0D2C354_9EURO|nr:uncharacterized protein PV07_08809 [Cladophialophora immunda]KIW25643.1 hypothetical protein PV07_08809 [Cladophialophora immunda]
MEVPLLSSLKPYERSNIADALETVKHEPGQNITEGEPSYWRARCWPQVCPHHDFIHNHPSNTRPGKLDVEYVHPKTKTEAPAPTVTATPAPEEDQVKAGSKHKPTTGTKKAASKNVAAAAKPKANTVTMEHP